MIRQLAIAVLLVFGLVLSAVAAQSTTQGGGQKDNSGQQSSRQHDDSGAQSSGQKMQRQESGQGQATGQQMQPQEEGDEQAQASGKTTGTFIKQQKSSQVLASSLIGITVKNGAGGNAKDLGTINDLIMNKQHRLVGVVIGVGGFLGIGQKSVGVSWDAVQQLDPKKGIAVVKATQKQVQDAPSFTTMQEKHQKQQSNRVRQQQQSKQRQLQEQQQPPAGGGATGGGGNNM